MAISEEPDSAATASFQSGSALNHSSVRRRPSATSTADLFNSSATVDGESSAEELVNDSGSDDSISSDQNNAAANPEQKQVPDISAFKFAYRPSVPAHRRVKESPLSSDNIFRQLQSHAGLFNLCIVVLVAVNSRLIIENLMKYGWLIKSGFWFSTKSLRDWPLFMCCLSLGLFPFAAFIVEKLVQKKCISEPVVVLLHIIITTAAVFYPVLVILRLNILAELLRFGDREFYKDWWNAKTIEEGVAILIAFLVSALFHELCIAVPCHMFKLWAFGGIMFQVPLVLITNYVHNKFRNSMFSESRIDVDMWVNIVFYGNNKTRPPAPFGKRLNLETVRGIGVFPLASSFSNMEDFRSKSYGDGRMQIETYSGAGAGVHGMQDLRCYSASYASSVHPTQTQMGNDVKFKKGKSTNGSTSKSWSFSDPELQRKKRVASYKVYAVEDGQEYTIAKISKLNRLGKSCSIKRQLKGVKEFPYMMSTPINPA
ncbi:hypothetical protein SESBI_29373 [Sesbania bispinosa]|nr:hypothetical protein SESBI_29373 [Sesbania bispinosa]